VLGLVFAAVAALALEAQQPVNVTKVNNAAPVAVGADPYSFLSTAAVQAAQIHGSSGWVWHIVCFNRGTAEVFLRLYDQTGAPGTGDTANIKLRAFIPGDANAAGFVVPLPNAALFNIGIGIRVTGAVADNDNTALAANEVTCNVGYQDKP
jgi:hypothetical protein